MIKKNLAEIVGDPQIFLDNLFSKIATAGISIEKYPLDHICYRVQSIIEYENKKKELSDLGQLLIESMVNGRPISTFKLNDPITYKNRKIFLIELPSPKSTQSYANGLEHAEFVVSVPLQEIINCYPQCKFITSGIDKKINAEITLKLDDYSIRFHNQSLENIIEFEKTT